MNRAKADYRVGVGASSILMILVVLAMAALGLLTFGSARDTEALTGRNVNLTVAYYEAAARVQQKLAMIDEAVLKYRLEGGAEPDETQFEGVAGGVEWYTEGASLCFLIRQDAGAQRELTVRGKVLMTGDARYELSEHTLGSSAPSDSETMITLMGE